MKNQRIDPGDAGKLLDTFQSIDSVLNVIDFNVAERDPTVEALLRERDKARADRNWTVADGIRDKLIEMGVTVQDERFGKT